LLVDHDTQINRDKTGPLAVAHYSVLLMHSTRGKCWSVSELRVLLARAGAGQMGVRETAAGRSVVTARKPG
jgi:3-hydroxy-5-methyl-1-naphthoate 3-O-methyltransferase